MLWSDDWTSLRAMGAYLETGAPSTRPPEPPSLRRRIGRILHLPGVPRRRWSEMVDVTGDVAVAKVVLDYPNARFTDYFALLKVDGEWRVMTKIFHRGPASAPGAPGG